MVTVINITDGGTLTLPLKIRKRLGLNKSGRIVVEDTADGVMLRSGSDFPVEAYSRARLKEIKQGEAEIAPHADDLRAALAKARTGRRK